MKKLSSLIIILFFTLLTETIVVTNADFVEDILNTKSELEKISFEFYNLKNPNIKSNTIQNRYYKLSNIDKIIKKQVIKKYKNNGFGYYQMQGIVKNYNYFIYYSNKYFSSVKSREIYWSNKEVEGNIYKNFDMMKSYYKKFKYIIKQKNMN